MKIVMLKSVGLYKEGQVVEMERKRGEQYIFASLGSEYVAPVEPEKVEEAKEQPKPKKAKV